MEEPSITVRKIASTQAISTELALAYGLITEEQARAMGWTPPPAPPPIPRLHRIRRAASSWWYDHRPHHLGPCDHGDCS